MKKLLYLNLVCLFFLFSCKKDAPLDIPKEDIPKPVVSETITGVITESLTLKADVKYLLKGKVFVKNNAVITLPAGVTVDVEKMDNPADKSALIITKGSKLVIDGTSDKPVVFTSAAASKTPGDWIGIIVLGRAPTNLNNGNIMGFPSSVDTQFGSDLPDDSSGSIKYLRLEYSGGLNPAQEEEWELDMASGLSLMGVGSGTHIEHIMVTNSKDDGFQFVGGTVNAKNLISYNNGDDDFDFDRGFTGKLQFLVAYRSTHSTAVIRGNGMESLNDKAASDVQPYTRPVISNMTIMGPTDINTDLTNQSQGIYIRRNTRFLVRNSIVAGYSNGALMMCPKTRPLLVNNQGSQFKYNLVNADVAERAFTYDSGPTGLVIVPDLEVARYAVETSNFQKVAVNRNTIIQPVGELQLKSLASTAPNLTPLEGTAATNGSDFSEPEYSSFFTNVPYRGAIGVQNWTIGNWSSWK